MMQFVLQVGHGQPVDDLAEESGYRRCLSRPCLCVLFKKGPLDPLQLAAEHSLDSSTDLAHGGVLLCNEQPEQPDPGRVKEAGVGRGLSGQSRGGGLRARWCPSATSPGNTGETWG